MANPHHHDDELHDHDRGLAFDLDTLMARRGVLKLFAGGALVGVGATALAACGGGGSTATSTAAPGTTAAAGPTTAATATTVAATDTPTAIPEETAGPYPGDGSNGVNVLSQSGIVRSDIRSSFGSATGVAEGVPLDIELTVLDTANGGAPMAGAAVYVWHCSREGEYSLYSENATNENYLRGVQETDASGKVTFQSIFPAAYPGRWPHIHFQVYPDVNEAIAAGTETATSQIALPEDTSKLVYAEAGYEQSVTNLSQTSLATDMVFGDGWDAELGTVTGTVTDGLKVALDVPV
jgi:protocatechuate 3,4-dioxygenase beta subunit